MKKRRKLRLNRETLRHLDARHLRGVAGGAETDIPWQCETGPETGPVTACNDTTTSDGTLGCETGQVACNTYRGGSCTG